MKMINKMKIKLIKYLYFQKMKINYIFKNFTNYYNLKK